VKILASSQNKALVLFKCGALGFTFSVRLFTKFLRGDHSLHLNHDGEDNQDATESPPNNQNNHTPYMLSFR
jgi:hypothetical protein